MQVTSLAQASSGLAGLGCERVVAKGLAGEKGLVRGGGQSKCVAHAMQGLEKEVGTLTELRQDMHTGYCCAYIFG